MCWPGALLLSWDCCCQRHSSALLGVLQCRAAVALGLLGGAPLGRDTADIFGEHKLEHPGVGTEVGLILSDSHDVRRPHPLLVVCPSREKSTCPAWSQALTSCHLHCLASLWPADFSKFMWIEGEQEIQENCCAHHYQGAECCHS